MKQTLFYPSFLILSVISLLSCGYKTGFAPGGGSAASCSFLLAGSIQGCPLSLRAVVTTLAGSGSAAEIDGIGVSAAFNKPQSITTDGTHLYVADNQGNTIRKIVIATGVVTTLAGSGTAAETDGTGTAAAFNAPKGITTDGTNLYVSDFGGNKIRKVVIATRVVTTLAGSGAGAETDGTGTAAAFNGPQGLTTDGTHLYVADNTGNKIRKVVIATGVVTTLAGSGAGVETDGTGAAASIQGPYSMTTDGTHLYIVTAGNKLRKLVIATGEMTTFAGTGSAASTDGTGTSAVFFTPTGITSDGTNLYVTDYGGNKIRKVVISTGVVTTLAGSGTPAVTNGTGASAEFNFPFNITTDGHSLYVCEHGGNTIRKIN